METLAAIERQVVECVRCPRLVAWREEAARNPPRRFAGQTYWARPVPAFGDPRARILIVGLAPAAHGGNRTGRVFTGDASGDFLFAALHAVGLANQPKSVARGDGLALSGALVTAAVKCAPPDNRPLPEEFANCREYIERESAALPEARVWIALGALAFETCLALLARGGAAVPRPRPKFAHGGVYEIGSVRIFATYHPSQQNTFTGKLTPAMLRKVLRGAVAAASAAGLSAKRPLRAPRSSPSPSRSASASRRGRGPRSR
jgi:uracil-DNA glycosylase family 4